jgi:hypothetical protein
MLSGGGAGALESLPKFLWRIIMKLPEFNLIFSSICPNFHGFPKFGGGGQLLPLPPVSYAYDYKFDFSSLAVLSNNLIYIIKISKDGYSLDYSNYFLYVSNFRIICKC